MYVHVKHFQDFHISDDGDDLALLHSYDAKVSVQLKHARPMNSEHALEKDETS